MKVTNDAGREFNVRVVRNGERYGLNDALIHSGTEALIEFYDAKFAGASFGPLGQFVSRYYASSLRGSVGGCQLHGGVAAWVVSAENVKTALALEASGA